MNETYKWLYDYYALPLMKVGKQADALKERIVSHGSPADALFLWDRLEDLCLLWGTESFAIGLQLGLRLMAGQRADGCRFFWPGSWAGASSPVPPRSRPAESAGCSQSRPARR